MATLPRPVNQTRRGHSSEVDCLPVSRLGIQPSHTDLRGMQMSVTEVVWDLVVFLALVAVGLVVLNLMARPR